MILTLQIWCRVYLGVFVVQGASCGRRRGIVTTVHHKGGQYPYSRLRGVIWRHGSAGLSVRHAACRSLSLTRHGEAWCVVRGWNLMPGAGRAKHSSDVILSVMSERNALGTRQLLCCRGESQSLLWGEGHGALTATLTQTSCNKNSSGKRRIRNKSGKTQRK